MSAASQPALLGAALLGSTEASRPDPPSPALHPPSCNPQVEGGGFVRSLLEEPEVSVIGAGRGPASSIIHKLFVSAQRAALLAPLEEETGRGGGADDRKPLGVASVPDFPPPAWREILLRTCVPRPAPYSKVLPQRLFCVLMRDEFRLVGAFSSDTSFF
ncbi:hypothetical protein J4Q44_G00149160 [Coregonus suidteri]|uniref:Rab3GAP catalytic subunit C-terminal domain-containing protein n=1 Tax=Coregonus suidteri TaxID=861788 RepID=A0AAN8LWD9_9TELE